MRYSGGVFMRKGLVMDNTWDKKRCEALREQMSAAQIAALLERSRADSAQLTLDEVGVLFIVTRDRIRELEAQARGKAGGSGT
jgi:DNA-directed RNA polymerase sigma subunit (sigma70/sigma32)